MDSIARYDIYYSVNTSDRTFSGKETIIGKASGKLWLNLADITVESIKIDGEPVHYTVDMEEQLLNIEGNHNGNFSMEVVFNGIISDGLNGIYYSKEENFIFVSTQFEPTGARHAFPCVDNPQYKAEFKITMEIPSDYDAISNMPPESVKESKGRKIVVFDKTPKMSTYLVYFGTSKYDVMEGNHKGKPVYVSSAKGKLEPSNVPAKIASDTLSFFENYFEIPYQLPKLHLIAVPEFAFGAMENWGAITFREIELMINESTSSAILKRVDEVISHELAHQWFGDLVTMKWWDDLWLNESFATFMSYKALDYKHSDWEIMGEMVTNETGGAMTGDSLRNTHSIHVEVKSPDEISQIFDEISYGKGSSILRMIESYTGEESFRKGVGKYLQDHSFSNAIGEDLWTSIEKVSDKPISKIMNAWITKPGYPLIEATTDGNKIKLVQTRFFLDSSPSEDLWPVPLTVVYNGNVSTFLMEKKEMEIPVENFLYINSNRSGFYRLRYDDVLIESIKKNIDKMDNFSKWGLISDYFSLFQAGKVKFDELISILSFLSSSKECMVMNEITQIILSLHNIFNNPQKIDNFGKTYLYNQLETLGNSSENEPINISIIRGKMKSVLAQIDIEYAKESSSKFKNFEKSDPNERQSIAISYALATNDLKEMESKLNILKVDEDKIKIIGAMGHLKGNSNLSAVWNMVTKGKIKKQDSFRLISVASTEKVNRKFILDNFDEIIQTLDKFFEGTGYTSRFLETLIPYLGLEDEKTIREFIAKSKESAWNSGVRKGLEYLNIFLSLNNY
jgi:tricorn protease interacting factor F2/3